MSEPPEHFDAILAGAQSGQGWAFEVLFRWLGPPVLGCLRAARVEDPDDLANEVFLRAFRSIHQFTGDARQLRAWVFTIARNAAFDERRRKSRRPLVRDGEVPESPTPDAADEVLERLARERVEGLLSQLVPDQREVLMLRVVGDLTLAETADVTGKSYGAVKSLQRRGIDALKRLLDETEGVPK